MTPYCAVLLLSLLMTAHLRAAPVSATASVSAVILPAKGEDGAISITPRRIALAGGRHGEFIVTNHSGETRSIHVEVEQFGDEACRLNYSPKATILPHDGYQVFRLFYVTEPGGRCSETFRLHVYSGGHNLDDGVYVDCY